MQQIIEKRRFKKRNIAALAVLFIFVYGLSFYSLFDCSRFSFIPERFWGRMGFWTIIGFDIVWVLIISFLVRKNLKVRIILILLGLAFATAVLTWWILENSGGSFHIFG